MHVQFTICLEKKGIGEKYLEEKNTIAALARNQQKKTQSGDFKPNWSVVEQLYKSCI